MQTFLPYPSFTESARVLDRQRLGKQRVEAYQILQALLGLSTGWLNHPATLMWRGYEGTLNAYLLEMISQWMQRGYKNTIQCPVIIPCDGNYLYPSWFGNPAFHAAHRSNLLRKLPSHYSQFGWAEPNDLPYIWPVRKS